jgi:hypothetical protein
MVALGGGPRHSAAPRRRSVALLQLVPPLVVTVVVMQLLGWDAVSSTAVPASSDLTGHLSIVELLRTRLLPSGTFRGWTHEWFSGFPAYYFYFPLPGVVAAVLGLLVPPPVALRIVAFAAPLFLPWALLAYSRWAGLPRIAAAGAVLVGGSYLLSGIGILGGSLASAIVGEFSYGWSLTLAILYLGLVGRGRGSVRDGIAAGALLAASILSHVLPALAGIVGSSLLLRERTRRGALLVAWSVAAGLSAFWTLPMLVRLPFAADLGWSWEPGWEALFPIHLLIVLPAIPFGIRVLAKNRALKMLLLAGIFGAIVGLTPQSLVMQGRLLPVYFLTAYVLAGVGMGEIVGAIGARPRLAVVALLVTVLPWAVGISAAAANFMEITDNVLEGTAAKPGASEFEGLRRRLAVLPPGRIHWENDEEIDRWGGPYVFSHLALSTEHTVLTGLLKESAPISTAVASIDQMLASSPVPRPEWWWDTPVPWNPVRAVQLLRGLGVRYLITMSDTTTGAVAHALGDPVPESFGPLRLFDLGPTPRIAPVCVATVSSTAQREERERRWIESWRHGEPWPVEGMPTRGPECPPPATRDVTETEFSPERIEFRTAALGVPHLVRVSHFPNWTARGARGPYPSGPGFMVLIPEQESVVLEFTPTWAERTGWLITVVTLVGLAVLAMITPAASEPPATESRARGASASLQ